METAAPIVAYSTGEVRTRIGVYIGIAMLSAAGTSLLNLATMTDEQLGKITALRWTLTILLFLTSVSSAGLNAFRAAIDRSTAGGNDASVSPNPTPASAP